MERKRSRRRGRGASEEQEEPMERKRSQWRGRVAVLLGGKLITGSCGPQQYWVSKGPRAPAVAGEDSFFSPFSSSPSSFSPPPPPSPSLLAAGRASAPTLVVPLCQNHRLENSCRGHKLTLVGDSLQTGFMMRFCGICAWTFIACSPSCSRWRAQGCAQLLAC